MHVHQPPRIKVEQGRFDDARPEQHNDIGPPLLAEVRRRTAEPGRIVTVVLPEFVVNRWWEHILHNQTGLYIKRLLLLEPGVVVASVPYHLDMDDAEPVEASA